MQAGRILIQEIKGRIERNESFAFESTLSGKSWHPILKDAVADGYDLKIYYLFLDDVRKNIKRIQARVKQGGHFVPTDAVMRRYPRCFENFWNLYRPLCIDWRIFDNSATTPKSILTKTEYDKLSDVKRDAFGLKFLKGSKL